MPPRFERKKERQAAGEAGRALTLELVQLSARLLDRLELSPELREALRDAQRLEHDGALARQLRYVAKLLRDEGVEPVTARLRTLTEAQGGGAAAPRPWVAWREHLVAGGDAAVEALLELRPTLDRQQLRSLVRRVRSAKPEAQEAARRALGAFLQQLGALTPPQGSAPEAPPERAAEAEAPTPGPPERAGG